MPMRVLFLQSVHTTHDERVWYHQRATLLEHGEDVDVVGLDSFSDWKNQKRQLYDVIITDTPKAVLKARRYSFNPHTKIVYDITEWYPSKKNLQSFVLLKPIKAFVLLLFNLLAGWLVDAFIFGEIDKAIPFRRLFPNKKFIFLPYYPDLTFISPSAPRDISRCCNILYAGPLTEEKGWDNVQNTLLMAARKIPKVQWTLMVISNHALHLSKVLPDNVIIEYHSYMPFEDFCKEIKKADIMVDLRKIDYENTRCLPIKLFYYMACGRPSIYSELQAIIKAIPNASQAVCFVSNAEEAATELCRIVQNKQKYAKMCDSALSMAHSKYNWELIKHTFTQFIYEL